MKRSILIVILLFSWLFVEAQSQLNEYIELASKNNPELKQAFNEYMATLEKVPQAKALPNPNIAFAYLIKSVETRMGPQEFIISASQMFPWFGTLKTMGNEASERAKAKYEIFLDIKSSIENNIRNTYFNLYLNEKSNFITRKNIELLNTIKSLVNIKIEAGMTTAVDAYRVEMEVNDLNNKVNLLNDNKLVLSNMLKNLINSKDYKSFNGNVNLIDEDIKMDKDSLLSKILYSNHKLLAVNRQIEALKEQEKLANKMGMPNFSIGFDYISIGKGDMNMPGTDAIVFPKIGISIPINRAKYKAMRQEAFYNKEAKNEQKESLENMLNDQFQEAWRDLKNANERIDLFDNQSSLATKSLKILGISYSTNSSVFEEYIAMERKLLFFSIEKEKAIIDKQKALSIINYLSGK